MEEKSCKSKENAVPKYGLKLKLDHQYPERWNSNFRPNLKQLWHLLPMIIRYIIYWVYMYVKGRVPIMDYIRTVNGKQIYGVPLGGIGAGSIGRGFRGEFCRFQLQPGIYEYNTVDANQFIVTIKDKANKTLFQSLLSTYKREGKGLSSWKSRINAAKCNYTGLYPRAWTEYDLSEYGVKLECRQISPIIPHNYKESSLPCAMFIWTVHNLTNQERLVTITFTIKNGTGSKWDRKSPCSTNSFSYLSTEGVVLYHQIRKIPCAYALGVKAHAHLDVTKCLHFDPNANGRTVWHALKTNGSFDKLTQTKSPQIYGEMGCGLAAQLRVDAQDTGSVEMCLVWDMPVVNFLESDVKYKRFYTTYFGSEYGILKVMEHAMKTYRMWEIDIYKWQQPIVDDPTLPDWYKSALFNETYFISDGGTVWLTLNENEKENLATSDPRQKYGRFAYLEGHEYRMYNTYDVHFYASFALALNWPRLQECIQYDMRDCIHVEIKEKMWMLYDNTYVERKLKNTVPHDVGDPAEAPFNMINAYNIHDVSEWRDLNTKFVLQVFRDFRLNPNKTVLRDMFEVCNFVMEKSLKFDVDGDGLIENGGTPDQTYDNWVMTGASAYCGGLWLAALHAMTIICDALDEPEKGRRYQRLLAKGKEAFQTKLWNGKFYNFDCSKNSSGTIMTDQLCGHWYLRCCGSDHEILPPDQIATTLKTIFDSNVMAYCNGNQGAVNGMKNGRIDLTSIQSEEVWTGVTYALASLMLFEGMRAEAWRTAGGMYRLLSERIGMSFETPEALYPDHHYRAIGYMRPLSIWSMQLALNERTKVE